MALVVLFAAAGGITWWYLQRPNATVLDYKTGGEEREGDRADAAYDEQMRTYTRILGGIYPGRRIEALLVFTDRGVVRSVQ